MHELRTLFPYGFNDRIGDRFRTNFTTTILNDSNHMLNINIKGVPNFIRIALCAMNHIKKSNL